jgi:uncharacterized protein
MSLVTLTALELRIIGCLIEKEQTTPDQYPLTLNSLTTACNQKSNRDPVVSYFESEVQDGIDQLSEKALIIKASNYGARVPKYQHRFCNSEFGELQLTQQELAIICVLFLRGPQMPGELRTRTQRIASFDNVAEVERLLVSMQQKQPALIAPLAREPGKRECRYIHLFSEHNDASLVSTEELHDDNSRLAGQSIDVKEGQANHSTVENRIAILEAEVSQLKEIVARLSEVLE